MAKIEFEGAKFEYDASALKKYSVIKAISGTGTPQEFFAAFDKVFKGKADEYADKLDDSFERMAGLLNAIVLKEGGEAKN